MMGTMATTLAVSDAQLPAVTSVELQARARALVPSLRERGFTGDRDRRLPDSVMADLLEAQLIQMLAPQRFGGPQADLTTFFDAAVTVTEGDGATGWLFGILGAHHWALSHFPLEVQARLYAGKDHAFFPMTFSGKGGSARKVDGGYVVDGRWGFATGIDFSDWVGVLAKIEGQEDDVLNLLIPARDVEVIDTWFMSGMRGTGSRDVVVRDVFVPDDQCLLQSALMSGRTPGAKASPEQRLLRAPFYAVLLVAPVAAALGLARRAIDEFTDFTRGRVGYGGMDHAARPSTHIRLANAAARWDAYHSRIRSQFAEIDAVTQTLGKFTIEQRLRYRRDVALAVSECARIVDDMVGAAGARAQHESSPFQLIQRDMNTIRTHVILDEDDANEFYGRHMLGLDLPQVRL